MNRSTRLLATATLAAAVSVAGVACSSDSTTSTSSGSSTTGTSAPAASSVTVTDPWARTSAASQDMGAAYMTLESAGGDTLVGVSVPSSVAGEAQIHETVMGTTEGTDMPGTSMKAMEEDMSSTTMKGATGVRGFHEGEEDETHGTMVEGSGEMSMKEIDSLELPAGEAVELKPGGYHIMLIDLAEPLTAGSTFELTLEFEKAGSQTVTVEVRDA